MGWGNWGNFDVQTYNTESKEFEKDVGTPVIAAPNGNPFRKPVKTDKGGRDDESAYNVLYDEDDYDNDGVF